MLKKIILIGTISLLPNVALADYNAEISLSTHGSTGGFLLYSLDYGQTFDITENVGAQVDLYTNSHYFSGGMIHLLYNLSDNLILGVHKGQSDENGTLYYHQGIEAKYTADKFELELSHSGEKGGWDTPMYYHYNYWTNVSALYNLNDKSSIGLQAIDQHGATLYKYSYTHDLEDNLVTKITFSDHYNIRDFKLQLTKKFGQGKTMNDKSWIGTFYGSGGGI